jgi:hypothetical protein
MATFHLRAGKHYHGIPPLSTLPWIGKQAMERYVTFDANCAYDSAPYNSEDVNKLFGLSFGFGGVHGNSARFGWRWSMADKCIELLAYVYTHGQRNQDAQLRFPVVAQVQPGQRAGCTIEYNPASGLYLFTVDNPMRAHMVNTATNLPSYGLTHGLYFGGAMACPHDMSVAIDRI